LTFVEEDLFTRKVRTVSPKVLFRWTNFGRFSRMIIPYIHVNVSAIIRQNGNMLLDTGTGR